MFFSSLSPLILMYYGEISSLLIVFTDLFIYLSLYFLGHIKHHYLNALTDSYNK